MKKYLALILVVVFIAGCGSNKKETQQSSQQSSAKSEQYISQGMKYLGEKDVLKAIRSFDMAIKSDPTNPDNFLVLAQVYMRLKNYGKAIDTLGAALRVSPDNAELYYLLAINRGFRWEDADKEVVIGEVKKSAELFMQNQDQVKFQKAIVLLKSLKEKLQ